MIVDVINETSINNLDILQIAGKIAKHTEYIGINLSFSDNCKVENIPDHVFIDLLDNIENRISTFYISWLES